ncbi:hypothetical protein [Halorubrum lipolyticum]|uniref:Uncharacterized protein n=1 Tax=Halorubrum lipolyticum DSM 21995 TaxID=1227482 RepID=M0NMP8_9EURY|nr:hypothetical protein [Halorubrum lipolyticum]EMA58873.1 hypothetical protein C469_12268 [Halorubrum lipolyticum DSM 21995]
MTTARQRQFLFGQIGWMLGGVGILASVGSLTLEYAFILSFVGLVVITALTAPIHTTVEWRTRLRWPLLVGTIVFAVLVALRTFGKFIRSL